MQQFVTECSIKSKTHLFISLQASKKMQCSSFVGSAHRLQKPSLPNVRASTASVRPATISRQAVSVIENRVAIRFQRYGRNKSPFYRLVAMESRDRRDGRPLEYLG